jgi:hypothetical protein
VRHWLGREWGGIYVQVVLNIVDGEGGGRVVSRGVGTCGEGCVVRGGKGGGEATHAVVQPLSTGLTMFHVHPSLSVHSSMCSPVCTQTECCCVCLFRVHVCGGSLKSTPLHITSHNLCVCVPVLCPCR